MVTTSTPRTRVLVPSGALGISFDKAALERGLATRPDIICIDGGSTDSGPYYLGTGTSKYSRAVTKSEWAHLMRARAAADVPLVIGSCGTCGTDDTVEWMFDITAEIARELGQQLKVATLRSSQPRGRVSDALRDDRIRPLAPAAEMTPELIDACDNVVALAGAEQIGAALETGADIVLAGRTTDTATIAALPLKRQAHPGAAWHGAKIAECGALCSTHPTSGVILVDFDAEGFTVEPLADGASCTPHSVSAHMLYENADPFVLYEPGGYLDVRAARYAALDNRRVRVTASQWVAQQAYTVKLEAARAVGFQTTIMAILREARYVSNAETWVAKLRTFLVDEIRTQMALQPESYSLEFRLIGVDGALGSLETKPSAPAEIGVLGIITAGDQETASEIGKLINPWVLHFPLTEDEELPTFAFPYSPAQSERGPLYEFCINHVMQLDDPMDAFRLDVVEVGRGQAG
jgi:hypothetical protein